MKNTINLNNLTCRLANLNNPHRQAEAVALIKNSADMAGFIHAQHHLSALNEPQRLNHLIWLAEYEGRYIGWIALEVDFSEDEEADVTVVPYALYVQEKYRGQGVASELIKKAAYDSAFWTVLELHYRTFEHFHLMRGLESEVLNLNLEIEARTDSETESYLTNRLSRALIYEFEQQTNNLPYFVHTETMAR